MKISIFNQEQGTWQQRSRLKRLKRSDEQDKILKNAQLFSAIRKNKPQEEKLKKVKKYLDEGADVNVRDANDKNSTPLHVAVLKGESEVVKLLLEKGAETDVKNNDNEVPLDIARRLSKQNIIQILEVHIQPKLPGQQTQQKRKGIDNEGRGLDRESKIPRPGHKSMHSVGESNLAAGGKKLSFAHGSSGAGKSKIPQLIVANKKRPNSGETGEDVILSVRPRISLLDKQKEYPASGSKLTLHGNVYQLKLLMLFLHRGLKEKYSFLLATEMDAAEKFDDLVFQYENKRKDGTVYRFLQAKHKLDESKKITVNDLLTERNGEFSLQKYFISYRKIKEKKEFKDGIIKDFIICTNIGFEFDDNKKAINLNNALEKVKGSDNILDFKDTIDFVSAAEKLADHIYRNKQMYLMDPLLTKLVEEKIIDIENKKIHISLLRDDPRLSLQAREFRDTFFKEILRIQGKSKESVDQRAFWQEMEAKELKIKVPIRYRFKDDFPNRKEEVFSILQDTSDLVRLAKRLAECVLNSKFINLNDDLFRSYHGVLAKEVINVKNAEQREEVSNKGKVIKKVYAKFHNSFLDGSSDLSQQVKIFRDIFLEAYLKMPKEQVDVDAFWREMRTKELQTSKNFGKLFELDSNPKLTNIEKFVEAIVDAITKSQQDNIVKIDREKTKKGVIKDNIDKLAGHVLITESEGENEAKKDGKVKFRSAFFNTDKLPGDLKDFKAQLKSKLQSKGISFNELDQYQFKINNFKTCDEEQLYSKPTLPNDYVTNTEIKGFLDHLIFGVNQPNEVELGKIIETEMGENKDINLIDSDLIASKFQKEMLHWMKNKRGYFLSHKDGKEFFSEAKQKLVKLISIGPTSLYRKKIKELGIAFSGVPKELQSFLNSNGKQVFNLFSPKKTILSAIKVDQAIESISLYSKDDSHIFTSLKDLLVLKELVQAFRSETNNLLVIECKSLEENMQKLYKELSGIIIKQHKKKIILITQQNNVLAKLFKDSSLRYEEKSDERNNLIDLNHESQKKILEKTITFQGKQVSLSKLINNENSKNIIDAEILSKLINNEKIEVGNILLSLSEIKYYYIDRTFNRQIRIKDECLRAREVSDIFAISNIRKNELSQLVYEEKIRQFEDNDPDKRIPTRFIILNNRNAEEDFKQLCRDYPKYTVHWLKKESGMLMWQQSYGTLSKLREFVDTDEQSARKYEPQKITDITDKVVIIAGGPGMGKSTVLTRLVEQTKEFNSSLWVIRINLNDYTKDLSNVNFEDNNESKAIDFLSTIAGLKTLLERKLFKHHFHYQGDNKNKMVLLFDGFDEISPIYKKKVIKLLQILKDTKIEKLWVTTRSHTQSELEDKLSVFSHTLKPFSREDQERFLKRFWSKNLSHNNISEKRLEIYTEKLLNLVSNSILDKEREFMGIPLQTRMMAEVFEENFRKFYNSNQGEPELPKKLDLLDLYKHFLEKKYDIYHTEKSKAQVDNVITKFQYKMFRESIRIAHQQLALYVLFPGQEKDLLQNQDQKNKFPDEELARIGIIQTVNGKLNFIHRTFAEYFVADLFVEILKEPEESTRYKPVRDFLREHIFANNNEVLRNFFDRILAGRSEAHIAALNNDEDFFEKYEIVDINCVDGQGRTALHFAASYGYEKVVKALLEYNAEFYIKDKVFDWTSLKYAAKSSQWNSAELLLQAGADPEDMRVTDIELTDDRGCVPLHTAAKGGYKNVVKILLEQGSEINVKDDYDWSPLHWAAEAGYLDVVQFLIERGADINAIRDDGWIPLHNAIYTDKLEVVRFLIEKGAKINKADKPRGWTPLHWAIARNCLDIAGLLIKKNAYVNVVDNKGKAPLHLAVTRDHFNIVKLLVEKDADVNVADNKGNTPLHLAAEYGYLDTVKYLIDEKDADFSVVSNYGNTPLHLASENGYLDIVKYLIDEKDADFTTINKNGWTPLHSAAENGHLDVVGYLIDDKKVDFNVVSSYGSTPLHLAARNGHLNVVKYLIDEKKTDFNVVSYYGDTPLHLAAENGYLDTIKYLVNEKGVDVLARNNHDTVLHQAVSSNNKEVIELILNKINEKNENIKPFINASDNEGDTPLMWAAETGKVNAAEILLEYEADVNAKNNDGQTTLHWAAKGGYFEIVQLLLAHNADNTIKDKDGKTSLDLAGEKLAQGTDNEKFGAIVALLSSIEGESRQHPEDVSIQDSLNNELFNSVKENNLQKVEDYINKGANVNTIDKNNLAPLHYAIQSGYLEIAVVLLRYSVDASNLDHNQRNTLINHIIEHCQDVAEQLIAGLFVNDQPELQIQTQEKQQDTFLHLSKFISNHFPYIAVISVKQGLYIPSFEVRQVKINGKCAAITRTFSQTLLLGQQDKLNHQDNVLLSNLQTSAELYERIAQGKQISLREEREIFGLSKLLDAFEQQLDSSTSSLPSSLSHVKSYKTLDDLSRYVGDLTNDFAVHLVTSNHVVAIYCVGGNYAYFDSNVAFVFGLKSVHQLMIVLEKAVSFAGYELLDEGFLVEHFDVARANNALITKQKQILTKPIQTERHLLSLQDQRLDHINLNGKQVSRVTLYDLGTKLYLEGSSPILINSDMNLSNENFIAYFNTGKISITAREYLESLRNSVADTAQELVQTTKVIPFAGSRNEIKHAQQIQELLSSDAGSKLKSYELNKLLESPIEKSIKALPYYLEIAKTKHWPGRLTNAAGRIQFIRGVHGAAVSCDRERGNTKDCLLNTGEISLSLVSQLIEDKVVQNVPKLIKSLKAAKFGAHILRGGAAIISSPFDIYDIIDSAIDLHNCEKGSNECKDAIAAVTFASTSLASGVVLTAIGAPGVGTAAGLIIMIAQGAYGGGRAVEEFQPYRLTFDENFRLFWHAFALQPVPKDIEYIKVRKDIVSQIAKQVWEQLQNRSEHVVAHVTGLGDVTFKEELECKSVQEGLDRYQTCTHRKVRVSTLSPSNATILMDLSSIKGNDYKHFLSRVLPDSPSQDAVMLCLPAFSGKDYERDYTASNGYPKYESSSTVTSYCENAMIIGSKQRIDQVRDKKVVFDLNLVDQGVVVGCDKWCSNDFIVFKGKAKVLGGENTKNTFILTSDFASTIFGGKNSTNILDVSHLSSSNYSLYIDNLLPFDRTNYVQDYITNKKQVEEQSHFYGINNVVISANVTVEGNGDKHIFYVKPASGYSKINVSKGSVVFPETALLLDCDNFTYSPESNVLSMKFSNFTLDIANYFNRDQQTCNFELIDKHGSVIEPLIDLAHSQKVKLFNLRAETDLTYNEITGWYESIAKASGEYQIYGTVRVKYPVAQERYGVYPKMIFGSRKSDIIPLTKETWYAEGREDSDSYVILSDSQITTEINNYAKDKSLDLLYIPTNSIQASRDNNNLYLHATNLTHSVKVKDYFLNSSYQHLTVIDENKDVFLPLVREGSLNNQPNVQLVPFYHATKDQYMFSLSAEKVASNSEVIVDTRLDNIKLYKDDNNLLLIDDKPLIVKLENFYDKHESWQNLTINFWHNHQNDKLNSKQLFELSKLEINYQDEIKSTYYDNVKEYIVSSNATIHYNQKFVNRSLITVELSTKRVGVLVLQDDIAPSGVKVSMNNNDLLFFVAQFNATFTIKNWDDIDHRVSTLKFNQEEKPIAIRGLDKFDSSQVSEIQTLINKAALSSVANQQLEELDTNVVNGIKYLLAVRGIENGISTHKCLGFDSAEEEQRFISAYHSRYNSEKLNQVLHHNQAAETLVWVIVKGYTDLLLENHSMDRRSLLNDLNKCFNAVTNKRIIDRIVRKLEIENIETVVPEVETFIRHHKEVLEGKIVNSLKGVTTDIDIDADNHHRKRRDESGVKGYEDHVFFNAQNNATFTIKNNQVTSGTSKLSSWINTVLDATTKGISKLGSFIFSSAKDSSLPTIHAEYPTLFSQQDSTQSNSLTPHINVDGTMLLLDVFIRKITGRKYTSSVDQPVSSFEVQASALSITEEFEKILNSISDIPAEELIDLVEVKSNIFKAIMSGNGSKIPKVLHSYVKEASTTLESEGAKDLLAVFQNIITTNPITSTLEEKTKHLPYLPGTVYKTGNKPQTCLNNIKVENSSISYCQRI